MPYPPRPLPCLVSFPLSQWPYWNLKASGYDFALWKPEDGVEHPLAAKISEPGTLVRRPRESEMETVGMGLVICVRTQGIPRSWTSEILGSFGYRGEWLDLTLSDLSKEFHTLPFSMLFGCWNCCCQKTKWHQMRLEHSGEYDLRPNEHQREMKYKTRGQDRTFVSDDHVW